MKKTSLSPDEVTFDPSVEDESKIGKNALNPKKNEILKKKGLPKDLRSSNLKIFGSDYYLNYELSWLNFNGRVLAEAQSKSNKVLERIKFLAIVCSNLDEFFQKRVGGLKRQLLAGVKELSADGMTPADQLKVVRREVHNMIEAYRSCFFDDLLPKLEKKGILIKSYNDLEDYQKSVCDRHLWQWMNLTPSLLFLTKASLLRLS